jgi:YD repeat-containing protein
MNSSPVCPRCGSVTSGDLCPGCGALSTPSFETGTKPKGSRALRILLIAGAIYIAAGTALIVFVVHHMAQTSKAREAWNRAHSAYNQPLERPISAGHDGPVARVDELKGSGRIYLVQMGDHKTPYSLDDFAQWLRSKYALDVQVLSPMAVDKSAWDSGRHQYVAELLFTQIKREHPDLAENRGAYLIGFTDANMFSVNNQWRSSFTQRDSHVAVISANGMQDIGWQLPKVDTNIANLHFQARLRRILLKDVAVLYWHLPVNNDPTSLLHDTLDPDLPAEDIYESDLDPARTLYGESMGASCVFLTYSAKDGIKALPGAPIHECRDADLPQYDESLELFEVDLGTGLFIDKHTDFSLPDTIPIQFQRVTRDGQRFPRGFGWSGTHNYDDYLWSTDDIEISAIHADGSRDNMVRVPRWLPILSLVKYVDTDYSGKHYEMHWYNSPFGHFDVKRFDGETKAYLPSTAKSCAYLTGIHSAQGQELKFDRDASRKLTRLTSPNGSWLRLSYGPADHIIEIDDSRGRIVRYDYDEHNRLTSVTYPSGEVYHYEYDNTQHLLTFSVAPDAKTAPRLLLRNEYENGRITKQSFADGSAYTYNYTVGSDNSVTAAVVRTPDGRVFNLEFDDGYSDATVREQLPHPIAQKGQRVSR